MSRVTCHVSHVTCHMSRVTCHNFLFFFGKSGEAYRWRVCYQRGLPRLVFNLFNFFSGQSGEAYRWRVCYQRGLPRLVFGEIQHVFHRKLTLTLELVMRFGYSY